MLLFFFFYKYTNATLKRITIKWKQIHYVTLGTGPNFGRIAQVNRMSFEYPSSPVSSRVAPEDTICLIGEHSDLPKEDGKLYFRRCTQILQLAHFRTFDIVLIDEGNQYFSWLLLLAPKQIEITSLYFFFSSRVKVTATMSVTLFMLMAMTLKLLIMPGSTSPSQGSKSSGCMRTTSSLRMKKK